MLTFKRYNRLINLFLSSERRRYIYNKERYIYSEKRYISSKIYYINCNFNFIVIKIN